MTLTELSDILQQAVDNEHHIESLRRGSEEQALVIAALVRQNGGRISRHNWNCTVTGPQPQGHDRTFNDNDDIFIEIR